VAEIDRTEESQTEAARKHKSQRVPNLQEMWRRSVAEPAGRCEGEKPVAELRGGEEAEPHHAVERALLQHRRGSSHGEARLRERDTTRQ
jgi:hypothetical protein